MKYFEKVLIANRGEIAIRVMRACRELNVEAVAIYSTADKDALHVKYADEAFLVGEAPPSKSYLNIERIVDIAKKSGSEAIHPGYGFLAENYQFRKALHRRRDHVHRTFMEDDPGNGIQDREQADDAGSRRAGYTRHPGWGEGIR